MAFSIIAIRVFKETSENIKKVLSKEKDEWYLFNSKYKVKKDDNTLEENGKYPLCKKVQQFL